MATRGVELRDIQKEELDSSAQEQHGSRGKSDDVEAKPEPQKTILDWIVISIVITGIITFAAFQIRESVEAHQNPSSTSSVRNESRLFPGLMICPFSYDNMRQYPVNACPKWSPQATLSFQSGDGYFLRNTNLDPESNRQSSCINNLGDPSSSDTGLFLATNDVQDIFQTTVKNQGVRRLPICRDPTSGGGGAINQRLTNFCRLNNIPDTCNGWTPPNVKCLVLDPLRIDASSSKAAAADFPSKPECNPMKEIHSNSIDSLQFFPSVFGISDDGSRGRRSSTFSYSGLEKFWFVPDTFTCDYPGTSVCPINRPKIDNVPSTGTLSTYALKQKLGKTDENSADDPIFSLYGGLVAVFYDASQGIPQVLDFERAQDDAMSSNILGSTVLLSTDCGMFSGKCTELTQAKPKTVSVTTNFQEELTNALLNRIQKKTKMTMTIQNSVLRDPEPKREAGQGLGKFQLEMGFVSSFSTVTSQYVSLSVLTTISIIFSTAATLWGSKKKIKSGIILIKKKVEEYLSKKRGTNLASMAEA